MGATINNPSVVCPHGFFGDASNNTTFEADGTMVARGDATTFNDIQTPMLSGRNPGGDTPILTNFVGNLLRYRFAVGNFLDMPGVELLHDWKEGSALEIHVHWATAVANNATPRGVKWEIEWTLANIESQGGTVVFPNTTISAQATDAVIAANEAARTHKYTSIVAIDATGFKIGAYLLFRVRRITATGTAPATDPFGLAVGVHYQKDTLGSRTISSK